jgi:hypothetical protein
MDEANAYKTYIKIATKALRKKKKHKVQLLTS